VVAVRVDGPLGPFRDGVLEMLRASGYSQHRAIQLVRLMAHLSRWLDDHGLGLGDLSSEAVQEFFGVFRLRHNWCRSSRSLAPVLAYLRAAGVVPAAGVRRAAPAAEAGLLGDFRRYLSIRTVSSHLGRIRDKTGCRRRADLTRLALHAGLV
jgi:integrase/recombinase XerD